MERHIAVPFSEEELKELHAGDYIYLTGTIYSARDAAHKRMYDAICVEQEKHPEVDYTGYHRKYNLLSRTNTGEAGTGHRFRRTYHEQPYG